jgi:hypothetical protein
MVESRHIVLVICFRNSPELDKMMEMIRVNDYASVEDFTFELLNQVGEGESNDRSMGQ